MRNVRFLKEPGYIFDLFFLFVLHFNKEYCLSNFINYNKSNEDTHYYNTILDEFPPISEDLRLFFHLPDEKKCFMTRYYFEPYESFFPTGGYDLSIVQEELANYDKVTENLIRFYFKEVDEKTIAECKTSISKANQMIRESDYNGDIKSALYSFFIDPELILRKLSYELMEKNFCLSQKYDANFKRLNRLQEDFDLMLLSQGLERGKNQKVSMDGFENIYVSFCIYGKNCVKTYYYVNTGVLLLGIDYLDCIGYLIAKNQLPELETFGNAISEPNRVGILNFLLEKREITIKDLEQEFGFTGTNAYYHLSLMIKAGMLKTRNRGRTVLYSVNKDYFRILCDALGKYYKD